MRPLHGVGMFGDLALVQVPIHMRRDGLLGEWPALGAVIRQGHPHLLELIDDTAP